RPCSAGRPAGSAGGRDGRLLPDPPGLHAGRPGAARHPGVLSSLLQCGDVKPKFTIGRHDRGLSTGAPNGPVMQPPPTAILSGGLETSSGAGIAPMPGAPEPPALAEAAPAEMTPVLLRLGSQLAGCPVYLVPPQPDEAAAATGLPLAGWWAER